MMYIEHEGSYDLLYRQWSRKIENWLRSTVEVAKLLVDMCRRIDPPIINCHGGNSWSTIDLY